MVKASTYCTEYGEVNLAPATIIEAATLLVSAKPQQPTRAKSTQLGQLLLGRL